MHTQKNFQRLFILVFILELIINFEIELIRFPFVSLSFSQFRERTKRLKSIFQNVNAYFSHFIITYHFVLNGLMQAYVDRR